MECALFFSKAEFTRLERLRFHNRVLSVGPGFYSDIDGSRLHVRFTKFLLNIFVIIFDDGIFHGINTISYLKATVIIGFQGLIDNRVGVIGTGCVQSQEATASVDGGCREDISKKIGACPQCAPCCCNSHTE